MANYYTKHSTIMKLPDKAAQEYALNLHRQASAVQLGDEPPPGFPADLALVEDWFFEVELDGDSNIWIYSDEGGIDAACAFMQHLLQRFDPTGAVAFEWSCDCSKPRTDAFGGGAAFITAASIEWLSTSDWLEERIDLWKAARKSHHHC